METCGEPPQRMSCGMQPVRLGGSVLALIGIQPAGVLAGAELLCDLPKPPAHKWSGFLIHVGGPIALSRVIAWALEMREARPHVPIGLAAELMREELQTLSALARVGLGFRPVLHSRLLGSVNLVDALDVLRGASVEREVLHLWLARWQPAAQPLEGILVQIIAHGIHGCGFRKIWHQVSGKDGTRGFVGAV
jgi:hypothetical protein